MTQRERIYPSDDRDLFRSDNELYVFMGENGDWYLGVRKIGDRLGSAVRITTSGIPRGYEGVSRAIWALYEALPEHETAKV